METPALSRRAVPLIAAGTALLIAGSLAPMVGSASSHREAPQIASEPQLDNTDVYAFVSPDQPDTVTMIANWIPFEEPSGGPTFYPFSDEARYEIHIDNNHDAQPDLTYRWTFDSGYQTAQTFLYNTGPVTSLTDDTLNFRQTYTLEEIDGNGGSRTLVSNGQVAPSDVGDASIPDYGALRNEAITSLDGTNGQTYAGQADDPFFLDLRVFDLLYGGDLSEVGDDTLAGYNVNTLALQVPKSDLAAGGDEASNPIIGLWSTTSVPATTVRSSGNEDASGDFVQVSRLGNPLVNEVVIPVADKDNFNGSSPSGDTQFLDYVTDPELPRLLEKIYGLPAPATPRNDLVGVFLTGVADLNQPANATPSEQLRLNMSIPPTDQPNRLGVLGGDTAGFPNGRRLVDDVIDIEIQAVAGELVGNANDLGDAVNANDVAFDSSFPYVALPHSGGDAATGTNAQGSGTNGKGAPSGGVATGSGPANAWLLSLGGLLALAGLALAGRGLWARRVTARG